MATRLFGFTALVLETEVFLIEALRLDPRPIDASLAEAEGTWKGAPAKLVTHAYAGGPVSYARFARLVGVDLEIGNVLCICRPEYALPILGADLVALGTGNAMVAADLSPTVPHGPERDRHLRALGGVCPGLPPLPSAGLLPGWCESWFSPFGLFTRVGPEDMHAVRRAYWRFPNALVELVRGAVPRPDLRSLVDTAQMDYARAHRSDDKGLRLLAKIFGETWAYQYIGEVLFPTSAGAGIR